MKSKGGTTKRSNKKTARGQLKRWGFRETYRKYIEGEISLTLWQKVGMMLLVWVVAGFVGWVYEFVVALIETGEVYMQGGNLLPWMNIYAIGAVVLVPVTYKIRRWPWAVFMVSVAVTWVIELAGGWLVYTIGNGTRYWNYDSGIWLIGNINGFVCLASVIFFGLGALILMYVVLPTLVYMMGHMTKRAFLTVAGVLFVVVMVDEITNLVLKNTGQPTAMDFYRSVGCRYQEF